MPSANSLDYCFLSHISKDVCPHFPPLFFLLFFQNSTDKFLWIIHILVFIAIANHCFPPQFPYPFQCLEAKVELSSLVWRYHSLPSHCLWAYTHWGLILVLLTLNKLLNFTESPFVHFLKLWIGSSSSPLLASSLVSATHVCTSFPFWLFFHTNKFLCTW